MVRIKHDDTDLDNPASSAEWRRLDAELPPSRNSTRPVSAAIGRATPGISLPDGRYIGADERCLLLVDRTFTAIGMTVLEVREGGC